MPEVLDTRACPEQQIITRTVKVLEQGGLVAMPTDTVYGLAGNAVDDEAVRQIFRVKCRSLDNPLPLLIAAEAELPKVAREIPATAAQLAERFWPGPLTIVVPKSPAISDLVTAGQSSVAVRVPDYPFIQAILASCPFPVAVTSANLSGQATLTKAEDVAAVLANSIDLLIQALPCPGAVPSTVIDLTTAPPTLLRVGSITLADLQNIIGPVTHKLRGADLSPEQE